MSETYAVVAYDRRGFGESPLSPEPFTHVEDLRAVLGAVGAERAWLVGSSAGGRVAVDAALAYPERVAGLVLLAPAVSGEPDVESDPETERLDALMEAADAAGDLDEVNRLEAWLWLDGPAGPEGRVSGPVRELFLAMNAIALRAEAESPAGAGNSKIDAWSRLAEITVPVHGGLGRARHRGAQRPLPGAGRAAARGVRPRAAAAGPSALPRGPGPGRRSHPDRRRVLTPSSRPAVRVNQLGYLPAGPKRATLISSVAEPVDFVVWTGTAGPATPGAASRGRCRP